MMTLSPFAITNTRAAGYLPRRVYALGNNRAVLLEFPGKGQTVESKEKVDGTVKIIDLKSGNILQTVSFSATHL